MPVEVDVLKSDLKDFRVPKKEKYFKLLLLHKGLTVDAFVWSPAAITGHKMLQEGWSYKLAGCIFQQPKTKKYDKLSNSTANFKWIFKDVKRPKRSKNCLICNKRRLHPDSKKLCMILRNVTIKDSSGTLHDLVVFNDECEKLLDKSAGDFKFDEEAQLLLEKIVGAQIKAKISSNPARNKQYGQSVQLQDIKIVKNAPKNREFNTAIYKPNRITGGGDDFVIVDAPCVDDVISQFEAASISVNELPKRRLNMDAYKIHSKPSGHVLIVNNINFPDESDKRVGSEYDERLLREQFERLDFEVFCETDLSAEEFQCRVRTFKLRLIRYKISACAVVVMSHGLLNEVQMSDGEIINIWSDIVSQFHESNFPEFTNKPKIFIFGSCQIFNDIPSPSQNSPPLFSDVILCFAAIPGHNSYRVKTEGTFFIQLLCRIFKQYAAELDLVEMLDLTQRLMKNSKFIGRQGNLPSEEIAQMCYHIGLGFGPFRFKPGDA
ncbi:unnamed protein product [Orchesella dallaii]|uniref:Uncharacterized protein n=1 Tax=Orchesella dallaii TaxID=48710 RepID=A0ABP1SAT5_9HEXA